MSSAMIPAAWSDVLQQIKPFGETDLAALFASAAPQMGIEAAQINDDGRSLSRFGSRRDFDNGERIELVHAELSLDVIFSADVTPEQVSVTHGFATVLDIALLSKDRRHGEAATSIVAPSGAKDRLTKTIDRDAFTDYLDVEFAAGPSNATVMMVGLDGMSVVNDTLGHTAGDVVIAETADRLRDTLRSCDIVSRLGGDVFGIYCPNIGVEMATTLAQRLQSAIAQPITVQSNDLRITAAAGITARAKGERAGDILSHGDIALQAAKGEGPGALRVFDGAVRMKTEDRRALASELVDALDENQLTTGMEPIVHLPGGSIVGLEAHVVWNHPTRGEIDRSEFMDLAELIGRVADVERAVLEFALTDPTASDSSTRTGLNISSSTLRDPVAVGWIVERLKTTPNAVIIEVSETAVSTGGGIVVRHLEKLREAGASIVLDDFGLSFASIRTLHAFAFDGVKLHNSLLSEGNPRRCNAIVKSVYASAAEMGFDVVHSGVDSDHDLRQLLALDSSISGHGFYAQGHAVKARVAAVTA